MNRRAKIVSGLTMAIAILSATALTGAAVYTVERASCTGESAYVKTATGYELVGTCVNPAQLSSSIKTAGQAEEGARP